MTSVCRALESLPAALERPWLAAEPLLPAGTGPAMGRRIPGRPAVGGDAGPGEPADEAGVAANRGNCSCPLVERPGLEDEAQRLTSRVLRLYQIEAAQALDRPGSAAAGGRPGHGQDAGRVCRPADAVPARLGAALAGRLPRARSAALGAPPGTLGTGDQGAGPSSGDRMQRAQRWDAARPRVPDRPRGAGRRHPARHARIPKTLTFDIAVDGRRAAAGRLPRTGARGAATGSGPGADGRWPARGRRTRRSGRRSSPS